MEHEVQAVVRQVMFLANIFLRVTQDSRGQLHVTWFVHAVYVTEGSRDSETMADRVQFGVRIVNVFRLGVQRGCVHMAVVHAIFFTTGTTQFDLQGHADFSHALEVFSADLDVLFEGLFGQVDHMGREQRFAGRCKVFFTGVQQAVDPRQQFLGTVVSVQNNRHAVVFSHLMHMMRAGDSAQDCRALRNIRFHAFTRDEGSTTVGELNDNRRFHFRCGFQYGVDRVGTHAVYCWQCEVVLFSNLEHFLNVVTSDDARFYEIKNFRHFVVLYLYLRPLKRGSEPRSTLKNRRVSPPDKHYCLARSSSIATAGRTLPSTNSRNAPPPVEM